MPIRRKWIQGFAQELLRRAKITSPPVPVEHIAKASGVRMQLAPFQGDLSGFVYRKGNQAVIWVNSLHPLVRRRFSMAHELGHYFLHEGDSLHVDRPAQIRLRSSLSSKGEDPEEVEANLFAAELLMPTKLLLKDLRQLHDANDEELISTLANRYNVSPQAISIRLASLGFPIS